MAVFLVAFTVEEKGNDHIDHFDGCQPEMDGKRKESVIQKSYPKRNVRFENLT